MAIWSGKSRRKISGGRRVYSRNKRKFEIGPEKQHTLVGEESKKFARVRGGAQKIRVMSAEKANVLNPKTRKVKMTDIKTVLENPSNPHYVQRNIITKGATIKTKLGNAKVTSRPGQDGVINAVLLK